MPRTRSALQPQEDGGDSAQPAPAATDPFPQVGNARDSAFAVASFVCGCVFCLWVRLLGRDARIRVRCTVSYGINFGEVCEKTTWKISVLVALVARVIQPPLTFC